MNEQSDGAVPLAFDALRESEARLRSVLDASGMGTFIWSIAEHRTLTREDIIKTSIHPIDRARCTQMFERAIEPSGTGTLYEEIRVLSAGGVVRWIEFKGKTVFANGATTEPSGEPSGRRAVQM